mmetsp:Transcript_28005/g.61699  ORF Transcript_28005/g.61699 Transcript_28005/m.61699 type:complete len:222 (-) Transcript_28005:248-913(-)
MGRRWKKPFRRLHLVHHQNQKVYLRAPTTTATATTTFLHHQRLISLLRHRPKSELHHLMASLLHLRHQELLIYLHHRHRLKQVCLHRHPDLLRLRHRGHQVATTTMSINTEATTMLQITIIISNNHNHSSTMVITIVLTEAARNREEITMVKEDSNSILQCMTNSIIRISSSNNNNNSRLHMATKPKLGTTPHIMDRETATEEVLVASTGGKIRHVWCEFL